MAPLLALLPLLTKIPGAVKDIAGVFGLDKAAKAADVVDHVTKAVIGGQVTPEQEQALDEITAKYRVRMEEIALEREKARLEDTQDARGLQKAALQQEDKFAKRFIYYYAAVVTAATFAYIFFVTFGTVPEANRPFANTILGFMLGTLLGTVIVYFFGSSSGSAKKSETMERILGGGQGK